MLTYFDIRPAIPFVAYKEETLFKMKVLKDLKTLKDAWVYKTADRVKCGIPDILICKNGLFIAIELKVDSPLSKLQEYTLQLIKNSQGKTFVVYPENWNTVFTTLKELP
jgi:hypothetical protein